MISRVEIVLNPWRMVKLVEKTKVIWLSVLWIASEI